MNIEAPQAAADLESEVFDILSLSDTSSVPPAQEAAPVVAEPAPGEVGVAPAASPVIETPALVEAAPTPAAPAPAKASAQEPVVPLPAQAPPAAGPAQPLAPPTPEVLRAQSLEATVEALQRQIQELQAKPAAGTEPGVAEPNQPPAADQPVRYGLTLPKQVQDALLSEDPQQNVLAINAIMNDLGTIVHNSVIKQTRSEMQQMFQALVSSASKGEAQQVQAEGLKAAQAEYYAAFPTHKEATFLPIIQAQSAQLATEFPNLKWGPDFINALGARVHNAVATLSGQPAVVAAVVPPVKPAAMMPTGNRGAAPSSEQDVGDEIMDTLSPF